MIKFALECEGGHEFEGWFRSGADYEAQSARGQIACPHCGSHGVQKAIMAPAVARPATSDASKSQSPSAAAIHAFHRQMRALRDEIHAKAEYVGGRFAEEARRIHFDESPPRGIYGEASPQDVEELEQEGVPFLPIPRLPEDLN